MMKRIMKKNIAKLLILALIVTSVLFCVPFGVTEVKAGEDEEQDAGANTRVNDGTVTGQDIYTYLYKDYDGNYRVRLVSDAKRTSLSGTWTATSETTPSWSGSASSGTNGEYIPLYEVYNPNGDEYYYSVDEDEKNFLVACGWQNCGILTYVLPGDARSGHEVYRLYRRYNLQSNTYYYTPYSSTRDKLLKWGWEDDELASWKAVSIQNSDPETIPNALVRANPILTGSNVLTYFDTREGHENFRLVSQETAAELVNDELQGWTAGNDRGKPSWVGSATTQEGYVPLYELHNPNVTTGSYMYTTRWQDLGYYNRLGYKYNGIVTYLPETSQKPVYRLYNYETGIHYFTPYANTKKDLINAGWEDEGVDFYATSLASNNNPDSFPDSIKRINKTRAKVTTIPIGNTQDMEYDGYQKVLLNNPGKAEGGTLYYTLTPEDPATWVKDFNYVTAADPGIYSLYYYVKGDDTHEDSSMKCMYVAITKVTNSFTGTLKCSDIYTTDKPSPSGVTAKYNNSALEYRYSKSRSGTYKPEKYVKFTEGVWYVKAFVPATEYYGEIESNIASFRVKKNASSNSTDTSGSTGGGGSGGGGSGGGGGSSDSGGGGGDGTKPTDGTDTDKTPDENKPEDSTDGSTQPDNSNQPSTTPQAVEEYTNPTTGEVDISKVQVPTTDQSGMQITKLSDGTVTVTDKDLGTAGSISPAVFAEGQVYRLYNPNTGEHFYTKNPQERDALSTAGWSYEADQTSKTIASTEEGAAPVYRIYNPNSGLHHYTTNKDEALMLKNVGWSYEGISMYAYGNHSNKGTNTYRVYCPFPDANGQNQHIYTTDAGEVEHLVSLGYQDEGIAWRVK